VQRVAEVIFITILTIISLHYLKDLLYSSAISICNGEFMVILFGNKKGGVWKSLTAINLAGVAANLGMKVCIIDADTNESSNNFLRRRNETNSRLESEGKAPYPFIKGELKRPEDTLNKDVQALDKDYDLVIVDTGGYENQAFKTAIQVADIVYLPYQPCQVDIEQLAPTIKVISETESFIRNVYPDFEIDSRLLITGADHNSRDLVKDAKEVSKSLLPWCSISGSPISVVKAVKTCQDDGLTLSDIKHPRRAMYELLLDEALGKRPVAIKRGEHG
tara:strand:- start:3512 stop:4339 length:828 start_codon:yes stop_codon:yes gene_type:complete